MKVKNKHGAKMVEPSSDFRLPLDLLLILDAETLEEALNCKYAVEHENEIQFCRDDDDLHATVEELDGAKFYTIDEIETDRIEAIIELLNMAEHDNLLGHVLDRIVR
jgi:hypothetical protein